MYAAFYKVMGAIAAAIAFGTDARGVSYKRMYGSYWAVCLLGVLSLGILVFKRVEDTTEVEDTPLREDVTSIKPEVMSL
jgi:hypothetical protein